jgi:hypothetical protein
VPLFNLGSGFSQNQAGIFCVKMGFERVMEEDEKDCRDQCDVEANGDPCLHF